MSSATAPSVAPTASSVSAGRAAPSPPAPTDSSRALVVGEGGGGVGGNGGGGNGGDGGGSCGGGGGGARGASGGGEGGSGGAASSMDTATVTMGSSRRVAPSASLSRRRLAWLGR